MEILKFVYNHPWFDFEKGSYSVRRDFTVICELRIVIFGYMAANYCSLTKFKYTLSKTN